jgi:hypothetical protein
VTFGMNAVIGKVCELQVGDTLKVTSLSIILCKFV